MNDKFKHRSNESELIDYPDVNRELLHKNLHELDLLNRFTRGHKVSVTALKRLLSASHREYNIVDLGCGSGDTLKYMAKWARKNNISAHFTGIDNNPDVIEYLQKHCKDYPEIVGINIGYKEYLAQGNRADVFHCSLFCHHLKDNELVDLLVQFNKQASIGFIINDLIRSPWLYYLTILFTRISNATVLAKNDGPISVLCGFRVAEFAKILKRAGILKYILNSAFGFRFLAIGKSNIE